MPLPKGPRPVCSLHLLPLHSKPPQSAGPQGGRRHGSARQDVLSGISLLPSLLPSPIISNVFSHCEQLLRSFLLETAYACASRHTYGFPFEC